MTWELYRLFAIGAAWHSSQLAYAMYVGAVIVLFASYLIGRMNEESRSVRTARKSIGKGIFSISIGMPRGFYICYKGTRNPMYGAKFSSADDAMRVICQLSAELQEVSEIVEVK